MSISRRDFMKGLAVFSGIGLAPKFLTDAYADPAQVIQGFNDDRVLVTLRGTGDGADDIVVVVSLNESVLRDYAVGFPHRGAWHLLLSADDY